MSLLVIWGLGRRAPQTSFSARFDSDVAKDCIVCLDNRPRYYHCCSN